MQVATNHFTDGLVMDLSPESTPNNCLTNALNATYVTINGNELQLQNDMGNAKFGAYLPQGYVPLGTTQLGGIIYTIIYNPSNNKTQIGSFPSPQITFDAEKNIDSTSFDLSYFENNLQYKKVYDDFILQPGDKFIFYFPTDLSDLTTYLYNEQLFNTSTISLQDATAMTSFIKFAIGTISQEGKLIYLNNLRNLYLEKDSITDQDYNVYNSTISGNLAIILTKVFCENTSLQVLVTLVSPNIYKIQFIYTLKSDDKFIPNVVKGNLGHTDLSFQYDDSNLNAETKWTCNDARTTYQVTHSRTFAKALYGDSVTLKLAAYKQINNLNIRLSYDTTQTIDLTKIGTGTVQLTKYKYSIDSNGVTISFSYNAFLNQNEALDKIAVSLYESNNNTPIYTTSFSGTTVNSPIVSIPYSGAFQANRLYIVKFSFNFKNEGLESTNTHNEAVTRWLITENNIFSDTQEDYHDSATIKYWVKSVKSNLTLGRDIVTTNYGGMFGTIEQSHINISEKHWFSDASLVTTLELDSNVKNIRCKNIDVNSSLELGSLFTNNNDENYYFNCSDMTAVNTQSLSLTATYKIKGSRTAPMYKSEVNIAQQVKDINSTKYQNIDYYLYRAKSDTAHKYSLAEGVFNNNVSNISYVTITAETPEGGHFLVKDPNDSSATEEESVMFYGIMLKGSTAQSTRLISFKNFTKDDADALFTILTKQLYVYKTAQELKYYAFDSDYSITQGDLNTIQKQISLNNASLSLLVNGQDINDAMDNFHYDGVKPASIQFNYIQDTSYETEYSKRVPKLPDAYIDSHFSLDSQGWGSVLISNKNIYRLSGTYVNNFLYILNGSPEYGQLTQFQGTSNRQQIGNYMLKADFYIENGSLQIGQHQTPSYFNYWYKPKDSDAVKIELCEWDYNNAITKVTN